MNAIERNPWIAGVVVVVAAFALRIALLHTARFGGDEALFFGIGLDIVDGKHLPLLGTQITDGQGRLPGPTFLYVMALPLLVARAPEAQYAFVELLGAITVGVFWHAMRRPFGERGAFFAALLMAASPWSALYADRTWNPNVLPLVENLALLAAVRVRETPSSKWLVALFPLAAVMPHFHMSAPVAWAGLAALVVPTWRSWPRRHVVAAVALAALCYVPLAVNEAITGFGNIRAILAETVGNKERYPTSFLWIPVYAFRFLTLDATYHELSGYWGGPNEIACLKAAFLGDKPRPFSPLRLFAFLTSLALAVSAIVVSARNVVDALRGTNRYQSGFSAGTRWYQRAPFFAAFVAALVTNLALMGLTGKLVFGHYVTNLLPFVFVAYAALGRAVFADVNAVATWKRALVVVGAAVFCAGGVETTLSISQNVDGRIGLEVHRKTIAAIVADGERDGNAREPVRLDFGYFSSLYDWQIFATRAAEAPVHFSSRAKTRVYRLVEKDHPMPDGSFKDGPVDVGYALLYRL